VFRRTKTKLENKGHESSEDIENSAKNPKSGGFGKFFDTIAMPFNI